MCILFSLLLGPCTHHSKLLRTFGHLQAAAWLRVLTDKMLLFELSFHNLDLKVLVPIS